ncbi:MAG: hypothetical protein L6R39_007819 [Caloplaca ligustica]|nr:MAG: hypothetical protein L6R39_007819 [Caloplaca ligustica]
MAIGHPTSTMTELYKQAQSRIPATISLPQNWLKSYEDFVTKNASSVGQIDPHVHPPPLPLPHLHPPPTLPLFLSTLPANPLHRLLQCPLAPLLPFGHSPSNSPIHRTIMRNVLQAARWGQSALAARRRVGGRQGDM